ncbi:DNA-binding transcriptional response regulator, NtrC family, contains REC, AAA-type ATPase, and a Fis-type DNA-binding domains [Nannocystis exedens]|uniref:DNA-binding transcriptional response regulator, NtrC family, contains REC, AAA-type ATPase, and a Fis-type DNA-binding domains n=1 Tax=Nannocystis exedens TaxID=54 RepID=A0A1I2DDX4_9BACT|nr:sigma-54 dependent transcriptional regulator [Nannocystis exedens]PCC70570.1 histidine kinase [Nannocystis exedens]SFE78648.1 DNA-binding transcriptional response regulator, NtrC family, contains REC, AAA-type ATPase, and a Fis-type DNA-binding domains [Nannocystis exedens]
MAEAGFEPVELLAALVAAASEAHTRRTWARRVVEVLARALPLVRLELGERAEGTDEVEVVSGAPDGGAIATTRRRLQEREIAALRSGRVDEAERRGPGGRSRLVVPLGGAPAAMFVALTLGPGGHLDPRFAATLGEVLFHLLRGQEVTQRVAELSRRAHVENRELREQARHGERERPLVVRSAAMQEVLRRIDAVAPFDTTVLLAGESGTGKELLAQRLHRLSARGHRPMVAINCGALPANLVESALFGHEAGAFTGATRRHLGVFERADRGTLFLDEVGELPLEVQVKLLRALQSQEFERVGGEERVRVDVRVIAATHRELEPMVAAGAFRRDLFFRLCVFPIRVPPLRERTGELPALTAALVADIAARLKLPAPPVPPAALVRLARHDWPGNVRELANVLEAAIILGRGATLALDAALAVDPTPAPAAAPVERLDAAIRRCITAALQACDGRIYGPGGAAQALGLKPGTLQSKMRKLGIDREPFVRE